MCSGVEQENKKYKLKNPHNSQQTIQPVIKTIFSSVRHNVEDSQLSFQHRGKTSEEWVKKRNETWEGVWGRQRAKKCRKTETRAHVLVSIRSEWVFERKRLEEVLILYFTRSKRVPTCGTRIRGERGNYLTSCTLEWTCHYLTHSSRKR